MGMDQTNPLEVKRLNGTDQVWVREFITSHWVSPEIVVHGTVYFPENLEGCKALVKGEIAGLITWSINGSGCEIVTLNSTYQGSGIGSALLQAVENIAKERSCARCWLVTTNDNLNAIRFYRKRGYRITSIARGAVDAARCIKPAIPLAGEGGEPIHDEVTLCKRL